MNNLFLPDVRFHTSYPSVDECPNQDGVRVVAFVGRSNSGKSSLICALSNQRNLARVSTTPGKTRLINYFKVGGPKFREKNCYLADLPGYGYARLPERERQALRNMVDRFLAECPGLALIVLVLDARRNLGDEERNILNYCRMTGQKLLLVRTKWDKLNQREQQVRKRAWKTEELAEISFPVSSTKKSGLAFVTKEILACLEIDL